ncbi:hypothetical protein [Pseudomonas sp. KNUC1026]|uniref:hypothetical protein n=1 Tax=Pseudomonas sp. KNUC1026 TaxID=2893890 RepID=UPI001F343480|nr:hypothetical protein [Pseudomonas sp. KNUC1026]UFH51536.1 hypothetical protein LN139_11535 [Pseudomonas sp. KNUC1026]
MAAQPPGISLQQMYTWLEQGRDRAVLDAIGTWLASDWLLSFDRRADFEQQVLAMVEQAHWSPAFFDALSGLMGWDDDLGHLPCEGWRWARLMERCHEQAWLEALQRTLASDTRHATPNGRAARFLLQPLSEMERRRAADTFSVEDWQACMELAGALEYQYPDACERLGLSYFSLWRHSAASPARQRAVGWFLACSVAAAKCQLGAGTPGLDLRLDQRGGVRGGQCPADALVQHRDLSHLGPRSQAAGDGRDSLSRLLIPARLYRRGSGLLALRHLLPLAVGSVLISAPFKHMPWPNAASAVVLFMVGSVLLWLSLERRLSLPEAWVQRLSQLRARFGR